MSRENPTQLPIQQPASEAPPGKLSKKRTRKGGKREKARKAKVAHNIVSSAFVPTMVIQHDHAKAQICTFCLLNPAKICKTN
jgi:hypothetical protein